MGEEEEWTEGEVKELPLPELAGQLGWASFIANSSD